MASFQAKISWERPKKRKKKIVLMTSYPTRNRKFQKNIKKVHKIKKHHYGFSLGQNKLGKAVKERKFKKKKKKKNRSNEFLPDP